MLPNPEELKNPPFYHEMTLVEGGTYIMKGYPEDGPGSESISYEVAIGDFYIGRCPVTQAFWKLVCGNNPARFKGDVRPVEQVSWDDAQMFILRLNKMTGGHYRLPSEAEWEFAARGGKAGGAYQYAGGNVLNDVGWFAKNTLGETMPVRLKKANELGLMDMCGNVWEWCQDQWGNFYDVPSADGSAREGTGNSRVCRGGSWSSSPQDCLPTYRYCWQRGYRLNCLGFRLASGLF